MTKELYSCFYQLRTCVITDSVLGVRFQWVYSPHYLVLVVRFLFMPCETLTYSIRVFSVSNSIALF